METLPCHINIYTHNPSFWIYIFVCVCTYTHIYILWGEYTHTHFLPIIYICVCVCMYTYITYTHHTHIYIDHIQELYFNQENRVSWQKPGVYRHFFSLFWGKACSLQEKDLPGVNLNWSPLQEEISCRKECSYAPTSLVWCGLVWSWTGTARQSGTVWEGSGAAAPCQLLPPFHSADHLLPFSASATGNRAEANTLCPPRQDISQKSLPVEMNTSLWP